MHGFALAESTFSMNEDAVAFKFRPAQDDALTLKLPALVVIVSGLEQIQTGHDARLQQVLAHTKAAEAIEAYYKPHTDTP